MTEAVRIVPTTNYRMQLSFFPLVTSEFSFRIHRRELPRTAQSTPGTRFLPEGPYDDERPQKHNERKRYEVSLQPRTGHSEYSCHAWSEPHLTNEVLFAALLQRCQSPDLTSAVLPRHNEFSRKVEFLIATHVEGQEVVWLRPYALKATGQFGFLVDFSFHPSDHDAMPTVRTLNLSLSLKGGRPNRDFYADRFQKISSFVRRYGKALESLTLHDGSTVQFNFHFPTLTARTLNERIYKFGNGTEGHVPFQGLRKNGPLEPAKPNCKLVFLFGEGDRPKSQELFRALRGDLFPTFPGMAEMFDTAIDGSNTSGLAVSGFSHDELESVASDLMKRFDKETRVVPVAVVPFSKNKSADETAAYFAAKHAFLKYHLPSQFVDRLKFDNRDSLKWSVSNIALAIFAKMGGHPWKVKPTTERGLIIGIGQAHRKVGRTINRYFAYSVLTDSSGLYESVRVLASSPNESEYLRAFKLNLRNILTTHRDEFDSFLLHATFTIRKSELEAIKETLNEVTSDNPRDKEFAALKFNEKNDFFGYSTATNSKVPYEGSVLRLSSHDYLIWFDGLNPQNPIVARRPERPVHVQVLFPHGPIAEDTLTRYFQDSLNIAGTNWRGFNARSVPISVYYAKLIADYYARFQEMGLEDIDLEEITPWFL